MQHHDLFKGSWEAFLSAGKEGRGCTRVCHRQTLAMTASELIYTAAYMKKEMKRMPNKHVAPRERACHTQNRAVTAPYTATTNLNFVIEVAAAANPTCRKGGGTQPRETRQCGVYGRETFTLRNKSSTPNIFMQFPFLLFLDSCNYKHTSTSPTKS